MAAAREHVEEIRRKKFSIGGEDLHHALKNLSAELYPKDLHFLMELIQNAEDNEYPDDVEPSLEFVMTSKDVTNTGAPATLLIFINEKGFSPNNIESICSVGLSTKKGLRNRGGYIGEKGFGFKSVFSVTAQPHIFSNGYRIKFNEEPCQQCKVGYIVPEWVEGNDLMLTVIKSVYGTSATSLLTTTLVLPLKPEKVKAVKDQLSSLHPEVLLFLSKIKWLSVREHDPNLNTINNVISVISSEKNKKIVMDADSYTLHLTANDNKFGDREFGYYMWKQRFPVKKENIVDVRMEVEEWEITLAFPYGKRLGSNLPGIYSYLPTGTVTNFPFIIQADFLLASSRENILWDNKWNQGILDCVPVAFSNAFTSLVKSSTEIAPVINMFRFLPVNKSSYPKLNIVRDAIKAKLIHENIIPCESYNNTTQKLFCKPKEAGRLKPEFWSIMNKAINQGVSFFSNLSHESHAVASSFDKQEYQVILDFLGIQFIDDEWYAKCIGSSNIVMRVSENAYIQLVLFIAQNWKSCFYKTNMKNTPLIKYVDKYGDVCLVTPASSKNKLLAADCDHISWLVNWNTEFRCSTGKFFLPKVTQEAIQSCLDMPTIVAWLKDEMKVGFVSVYEYADLLSRSINNDRKLAVTYAHFLYTSSQNNYLWKHEVHNLCRDMPIVDRYGQVVTERRSGVLVPGDGSRWVDLIGPDNPWREHNYIELGEDYNNNNVPYFCEVTSGEKLVSFLKASDVPNLIPPNAAIPTLASPISKRNTFLLLAWVRKLRTSGFSNLPERFLSSIKNGRWLKIYSGGRPAYCAPSESFMLDSSTDNLVQYASGLVDFPVVDEKFYGNEMRNYKDELEAIGVRFEGMDACEFIGKRLMDLASSSSKLTKQNVFMMLNYIKYLGHANPRIASLIKYMREEKWVRTCRGDMTPGNSVLFSEEWKAAKEISEIPFIDKKYYGKEILSFKDELNLLGVIVNFNGNYQLIVDHLYSTFELFYLSSEAMLLVLKLIQNLEWPDKVVSEIRAAWCMKTNMGYAAPLFCCLSNPESQWGGLLQVFESFPVLDEYFYGSSIFSYSNELKKIGVKVDFEVASKKFTQTFEDMARSSSIKKEHVLSFLQCYKKLKELKIKIPLDLKICIRNEKWLRTRLGDYRAPSECILFSKDWEQISSISLLPFIDDTDNFYGSQIHDYHLELKKLGVVTDLKNSGKFVAHGLVLPQDSTALTPENVYTLLESLKELKERDEEILREKLSQKKWLKTYFGYKRPDECLLFSCDWNPFLKCNDGPFIDEEFYGSSIASYRHELSLLGVITDVSNKGCQLLVNYIECHSNFETISRIYNYLSTFKWRPVDQVNTRIWNEGEWVMPQDCVLHDKSNLFGEQLNVLENSKYGKEILDFFANTLEVKVDPSVEDYCKLWKAWETSGHQITHNQCCAFWEFVVQNWYPTTEDTFTNNLQKLPVLDPNANGISLIDKHDVFIGDDLCLTDLFLQSCCSRPIFAWFPEPSQKSLINQTKLVDIYTKLGVRTLSECAQKYISEIHHNPGSEPVANSKEKIIKKGLVKLILSFLADPNLNLEPYKRYESVGRLLALEAFESREKMRVGYRLTFSSGDVVDVERRRMVHWDKRHSKLCMQKMDMDMDRKYIIEYASHFAEEIAEGVLCENQQLIPDLSELIRLGYFVDFDEEAVDFLMKTKNLHIFVEDQDYLSFAFSSSSRAGVQGILRDSQPPTPRQKKRRAHNSVDCPPSYELRSTKRRRQKYT